MPNGLKPQDAFYSDIKRHLIKWAAKDDKDYYETENYWYCFIQTNNVFGKLEGSLSIRRFDLNSPNSICVFASELESEKWAEKWPFDLKIKDRIPVE